MRKIVVKFNWKAHIYEWENILSIWQTSRRRLIFKSTRADMCFHMARSFTQREAKWWLLNLRWAKIVMTFFISHKSILISGTRVSEWEREAATKKPCTEIEFRKTALEQRWTEKKFTHQFIFYKSQRLIHKDSEMFIVGLCHAESRISH